MADLAVREALAAAEKVLIALYRRFKRPTKLHDDVERAQNCLKMMHACLRNSEDLIDGDSTWSKQFSAIAYQIENVLEEFMITIGVLQISEHINNISQRMGDDKFANELMLEPLADEDFVQTNENFGNISQEIDDDKLTDEVVLKLAPDSDAVQTTEDLNNKSQQTTGEYDKVANFIENWTEGFEMSRDINDIIEKNISFVQSHFYKSFHHDDDDRDNLRGRSRSKLEDSLTFSYQDLAAGDEVVGFEEHQGRLIKELIKEDSNFSTILIVGPGGSGKSTLAKNIFENKYIRREFDCHIWYTVPRRLLQLDELLKEMLTDLGEKSELVQEGTDPKAKLRLTLQHKRSLLVLDDVWRKQDLRNILKALPDGARGRKVMITSRNSDVVSFLSCKYIHDLSPGLDMEKGKELLWKKVLPDSRGECPRELEWYSRDIVKWSGCLPLAISEIGTLLATKPATEEEWKGFLENLGSEIKPGSSLSIISRILQPSFMDLPIHLKTCFLYLSVFPADYWIRPEMLIHMWVAEGFVEPRSGLTMEQVAEGYLDELIGKSLVVSVAREICGRLHTYLFVSQLVRDFIFSKEENFITVFEPPPRRTTCAEGKDIRRLSVHGVDDINVSELINIRTLVFCVCRAAPGLIGELQTNKFLRVLDLEDVDYWEELPEHFCLRYLKLKGYAIKEVPKSIRNLRLLETLNLEDTRVSELPEEVCQLGNLRHLLFDNNYWAAGGVKISPGIIEALSSIHTLRRIMVTETEIVKALRKLKGLRELEIGPLGKDLGKELCISLEEMEHLSTLSVSSSSSEFLDLDHMQGRNGRSSPPVYLQHLYLSGRLLGLPKWISQLTSLQKLGLHNSRLDANPLEVLQALPHLMELILVDSYKGENLLFNAKTFKKLMKLCVKDFLQLNLVAIEVGALPLLKELQISSCPNLKYPLECIDGLNSLCKLILDDLDLDL